MKKIQWKIRFWLAVGLTLLLACTLSSALFKARHVSATENWSEVALEQTYMVGDEITVPVREMTVGAQRVIVNPVIMLPDGSATRATSFTLRQRGKYIVRYTAVADGKTYVDDVEFFVNGSLVSVGENSSVTYGKYVPTDESVARYITRKGLLTHLSASDTLTYEKLLDVSQLTREEPLIEFYVTPEAIGSADCSRITVTLTDAVNPDVYISIYCRQSPDEANAKVNTYLLAAGNGQTHAGYEASIGKIHVDNGYGSPLTHSFTGNGSSPSSPLDTRTVKLYYDRAENAAYSGNGLIADFDAPAFFESLWGGFPSGKVRLTVNADMFSKSPFANFCILSLFGADDLTEVAVDEEPPVITIDAPYTQMPIAKVGMDYLLPTATAYDYNGGSREVTTCVYFNYNLSNSVNVSVENGKFFAKSEGEYAIVYTASDLYGNLAQEVLWVKADKSVSLPEIKIDAPAVTEVMAGRVFDLPAWRVTESMGSGNKEVTVTVTCAGETQDVTSSRSFVPWAAGAFQVTYEVKDYLGQTAEESFELSVSPNPTPVFFGEPALPLYFISGSTYTVPAFYANDYSMGTLEKRLATAEIAGKAYRAGDEFVPEAENGGEIEVKFVFGAAEKICRVRAVSAWVIDGRPRLHIENYLVADGVTVQRNKDNTIITKSGEAGKWTFANALNAEGFRMTLNTNRQTSSFQALKITLTDSVEHDFKVEALLENTSSATKFTVNEKSLALSGGFRDSADLTVVYSAKNISVSGSLIAVKKTADGRDFNGFPSGKIYLSVEFVGGNDTSGYGIYNINNQPINSNSTDSAAPLIVYNGNYGGVKELGARVVLPSAIVSDVLDPNAYGLLTVTDPMNNIVKDVDGTELNDVDPCKEYTILTESIGAYKVKYTLSDSARFGGSSTQTTYQITVEDDESPTITFKNGLQTEAMVGDVLVFPSYTLHDNVTAAEGLQVDFFVITPTGYMLYLPAGSNSVQATCAGVYEMCVMVSDEVSNTTVVRCRITVTEKETEDENA